MTLSEKTAYLKGLADGMKISTENDEGKLLHEIINVLEEVADSIGAIEEECDRLNEYVEELDEDLGDVEEYLFDDEEDYEDEDDDNYDDDEYDEDDEDYDDDVIEIECPNCGETICVPPTVDYAHLICPACNEEFSYIEEDEGPTDED
ncbi:MAG: zinc ribbon domain-containing protein [Clostridia bacterium]|nr:zinc ribbon domain-containing protein [Clostridia bacterium]